MNITLTNTLNYIEKKIDLISGQIIEVDVWNIGAFKGTVSFINDSEVGLVYAKLIEPYFSSSHFDYSSYEDKDMFTFKVHEIGNITEMVGI